MVDLNDPGVCRELSRQIKRDIDAYCKELYQEDLRKHLGASIIGHDCARYIWYGFRWMFWPEFDGRMYRLFNRGHREEERFVEWLRGIGATVSEVEASGNQHRISAVGGHFGGSLDSKISLPLQRYGLSADQALMVGEFKTHNYKSFAKFSANDEFRSVKSEQPKHYAQMCVYGFKTEAQFGLYLPISKNDDDIRPEIVKLDWMYAEDLLRKGERIIEADVPPPRIAANAAHFTCKFCDAKDLCWNGKPPLKSCRSCRFAQAAPNKEWFCRNFNATIPQEWIASGCDGWTPAG